MKSSGLKIIDQKLNKLYYQYEFKSIFCQTNE